MLSRNKTLTWWCVFGLVQVEPHLEPEGTPEEQAPARNAYRYLNNRLDCLDYPGALALGLPIGSGMIESGHRQVQREWIELGGSIGRATREAVLEAYARTRLIRRN